VRGLSSVVVVVVVTGAFHDFSRDGAAVRIRGATISFSERDYGLDARLEAGCGPTGENLLEYSL